MKRKQISSTFVRQQDHSDCGVACLASVINYYRGETSLEHLRRISGTTQQGTTMLGLFQAAQQLGLEAEGVELDEFSGLKELQTPAILHVTLNGRFQHYIVFYGFESNKIVVGDPASGITQYSYEEL